MPIQKVKFTAQIQSSSQGNITIPISSFAARTSLYTEPRSTNVHTPQGESHWVQYMRPVVYHSLSIVIPSHNYISAVSARISDGYINVIKWIDNVPKSLGSVPIESPRIDVGSKSSSITLSGETITNPFTITTLPTREVEITDYDYIRQSVNTSVRCGLNNNINIGEFMLIGTVPYRVTQIALWDSEAYGTMELTSQPMSFGYVN